MYVFDAAGRIVSTREPQPSPGPLFTLIRGTSEVVWAVGSRVRSDVAMMLDELASNELPTTDLTEPSRVAEQYRALVADHAVVAGPAFSFPRQLAPPTGVTLIDNAEVVAKHFDGWTAAEMLGRTPVAAVLIDDDAVSVCACARRSAAAAEASLETATAFRGRGLAVRVTTAWALAVRASGRIPLYSSAWDNTASLAVARTLGLQCYAASWSVYAK